MKAKNISCLISAAVAALAITVLSGLAAESAGTMSVQVKSAPLRDSPSFIGKATASLSYGDEVQVSATQGAWMKVRAPSATGWIHSSALSSKRIVLKSGRETAQTRASGDELALAGKGFNSDVESEFKKQHRDINFSQIDRMEKIRIAPAEMQAFLKEGGVTPKEGGAK